MIKNKQEKFTKIKKLLKDNANVIQKLATVHHAQLIGGDPIPNLHFEKYSKIHIKIVKVIANNLGDSSNGIKLLKKFGEELAKDSIKDGLKIEEAVDGNIFLKQAIWKMMEGTGMLKELSTQDFYLFSQTIGKYCDVLASQIAFTYHNNLTEKIAKNEAKFRALTEKSADAIALVKTDGRVIYASPATQVLMGYTPEEFQKLKNPFELVPPDDRKIVSRLFEKLITKPGTTEYVSYRVLHKKGHYIWIESAMTNLLEDPNVGAIVLNYRDISERKKLEQQKDDFIGIASHELKTPITSVKAYTQLLQYRFRNAQDVKSTELVGKMDAQLDRLTSLISDLLDVTKIEGRRLKFDDGYFDFNELVNETVEELQRTTEQHTIVTKFDDTKTVYGDRNRIGQVLINLLTNAVKYSPRADKVIVKTTTDKTDVTLCVQDFGIGISEKEQLHVFERFFRVGDKGQETYPGLGLGLYIAAEIIRRQNGKIWVESKKGKGSTFCFSLPIEKKKQEMKPPKDAPIKKGLYHEGK